MSAANQLTSLGEDDVQPAEQAGTRSTLLMLLTVETLVSQLIVSQMDCQSLSTVRGFSDVLSLVPLCHTI